MDGMPRDEGGRANLLVLLDFMLDVEPERAAQERDAANSEKLLVRASGSAHSFGEKMAQRRYTEG
jgi:hypothetical protein